MTTHDVHIRRPPKKKKQLDHTRSHGLRRPLQRNPIYIANIPPSFHYCLSERTASTRAEHMITTNPVFDLPISGRVFPISKHAIKNTRTPSTGASVFPTNSLRGKTLFLLSPSYRFLTFPIAFFLLLFSPSIRVELHFFYSPCFFVVINLIASIEGYRGVGKSKRIFRSSPALNQFEEKKNTIMISCLARVLLRGRETKRRRGEEGTGKMVDSCFFFLLSISILPK
jgi:hypothetical protein